MNEISLIQDLMKSFQKDVSERGKKSLMQTFAVSPECKAALKNYCAEQQLGESDVLRRLFLLGLKTLSKEVNNG